MSRQHRLVFNWQLAVAHVVQQNGASVHSIIWDAQEHVSAKTAVGIHELLLGATISLTLSEHFRPFRLFLEYSYRPLHA